MKEEFSTKKLRAEMAVSEKALWDAMDYLRKRVEALERKPEPDETVSISIGGTQGDQVMSNEDQCNHLVKLCKELLAADERGQGLPYAEVMQKIKKEIDVPEPDMIPSRGDVGRWVEVRDSDNDVWEGPFILTNVTPTNPSKTYKANSCWWEQARIVPGVGRITMQKHDGTAEKPDWLTDEDELLIEYQSHVKAIRTARNANWKQVYYYQRLEVL